MMAVLELRTRGRLYWRCRRCGWEVPVQNPPVDRATWAHDRNAERLAAVHQDACRSSVRVDADSVFRWEFDGAA